MLCSLDSRSSGAVSGDVCFLLSYGRIVSEEWLDLHRHNLVVHASALPQGKGWSPMTWQILEGATSIPLTLFEAAADLDAGPIHAQEMLQLKGHELAPEWQQLQAMATVRLCANWLSNYPLSAASPQPQIGAELLWPTHGGLTHGPGAATAGAISTPAGCRQRGVSGWA